jgi:hypothetical protein
VSASSAAFSSSARRACSISWFLRSTSVFCSASSCALSAISSLVCCSSFCCDCSSPASCCDCESRRSVRIVASMVLSTMPIEPESCSRNARCEGVNSVSEASSITALIWSSNSTGSTTTLRGTALIRPDSICTGAGGHVVEHDHLGLRGALADQALAEFDVTRVVLAARIGVAGELAQAVAAAAFVGFHHVHHALLRVDQRREFDSSMWPSVIRSRWPCIIPRTWRGWSSASPARGWIRSLRAACRSSR